MKKIITILAVAFCLNTNAQVCFSPAINYTNAATNNPNNSPNSVISRDFNGDGKADLAAVSQFSDNVCILLGNGTGAFGAAANYSLTAGSYPVSICSGDFNGDGKIDLATANDGTTTVSVLLGTGTGVFGIATNITVPSVATTVISADFNGDGKADLAIANNGSNNISILLGTGTGSFGSAINFTVGTSPQSIISTDFNGDGKADLATANPNSNNVSILIGTGTGTFSTATNFMVGTNPYSVCSADFNGDGKTDLATSNLNSNNVSVLIGTGTGTFGTATNFTVDNNPYSVCNADFNGDGLVDLATTSVNSNLSILLGTGTGSFSSSTDFASGIYAPMSAISTDFNGDGKNDLATEASVLLNTTNTITISATATIVCAGTSCTLTGTGSNTYSWSTSVSTISISIAPTVSMTYYVSDGIGCSNTASITINVDSTIPNICMVSTDSASNYSYNIVYWNNTYANVDSFRVYRYDPVSNSYLHIGSVSKDSLSEFKDTTFSIGGPNGGNPQYGSWQYKLAIRDTCGNISALSPYHSTIFIQENGSNFSWTSYIDSGYTTPPTGYSFLRDDNNTGNFHVLANLGHTATSTSDPNYASYPNGNWRIDALGFTCNPTYRLAGGFNNVNSTLGKSHSNTFKQLGQTTGINKHVGNGQVSIYPNPTNQYLYLKNMNGSVNIDITNVTGQIVKSIRNTSNQIDVSDMPTGFYFLRITEISKQAIQTIKFVKE